MPPAARTKHVGFPVTERETSRFFVTRFSQCKALLLAGEKACRAVTGPSDPNGIRTRATTLKGWCANHYTMGSGEETSSLNHVVNQSFGS
ncbi:hypothetical protein MPNT_140013 [Candidatus Methylacidithermus pantelleriae]|uniref:Uncharacterized protein n=1 Tax=Candidatus Methylacidithermus pantelleriae TaxID=2744239 RepID=A0A8J2BH09_9BACT|nr:hypothetical protein MPNT_140013 [Candidatus Methylacidithermus pantelleriae]